MLPLLIGRLNLFKTTFLLILVVRNIRCLVQQLLLELLLSPTTPGLLQTGVEFNGKKKVK